jgi:hypothetical protein
MFLRYRNLWWRYGIISPDITTHQKEKVHPSEMLAEEMAGADAPKKINTIVLHHT